MYQWLYEVFEKLCFLKLFGFFDCYLESELICLVGVNEQLEYSFVFLCEDVSVNKRLILYFFYGELIDYVLIIFILLVNYMVFIFYQIWLKCQRIMLEKNFQGVLVFVFCLGMKVQVFYNIGEFFLFVFKIFYGFIVRSRKIKGIIGLFVILCWIFLYIWYLFIKFLV